MPGFWEQLQKSADAINEKERQIAERQLNVINSLQQQQQQQYNMLNTQLGMNKDFYGLLSNIELDRGNKLYGEQESLLERTFNAGESEKDRAARAAENDKSIKAQLALANLQNENAKELLRLENAFNLQDRLYGEMQTDKMSQLDWKNKLDSLVLDYGKYLKKDVFGAYDPTLATQKTNYGNIDYQKAFEDTFKWLKANKPWYKKIEVRY